MTEATYCHWNFQPADGSQQTIAQGTDDQQYTVDNSSTNPDLTIKSIALNEAGVYTCYATNAAGTSQSDPSSSLTLTVTGGLFLTTAHRFLIMAKFGFFFILFFSNQSVKKWCYMNLMNTR